ncbi:MAG: ion transporter [Pseudomonadales bacterium]|nr:ion transporter [Pseudomonadales bacterium]MCP5185637.1 ion transporter [Pseudomonadales bacterium]
MIDPHIRHIVARLLGTGTATSRVSRAVDYALITLIFLNVVAVILDSEPAIMAAYGAELWAFEVFSVAVFTIEYFLRVWSAPDLDEPAFSHPVSGRLRFMVSPSALVDLIAVLPFYLGMFFSLDLRALRVIRLVRVFKLTRYSTNMNLILTVFRAELHTFVALFGLMVVLLVLTSSGIYLLEHDVQPEAFGTIPRAMWWAMVTLTTVGYGDVIPVTTVGRIFGGVITLIGVGMVALPAGILASSFSEQLRLHRKQFENRLADALHDGHIDQEEFEQLEELRQTLGLSTEETQLLYDAFRRHQRTTHCPHCNALLR